MWTQVGPSRNPLYNELYKIYIKYCYSDEITEYEMGRTPRMSEGYKILNVKNEEKRPRRWTTRVNDITVS
jgi:hypothetical protein